MHILSIGEKVLHGESNRLWSHKARGGVGNDCLQNFVPAVDVVSMGCFDVLLNCPEIVEHRHVKVMSIGVGIRRQPSLVDRIWMKRVACGRTA